MGKIICEICGTSYPETSMQCPICGCVKPVDTNAVIDKDAGNNGTYTYVKGGHFSKKNVKRRLAGKSPQSDLIPPATPCNKKGDAKTRRTVVIISSVLLLAIILIGVYLVIDRFSDVLLPDIGTTEEDTQQSSTDQIPTDIPCTALTIDPEDVLFESVGQQLRVQVTITPADTTEALFYTSENPEIVSVDGTGKLTAVSEGETFITVTCGTVQVQCRVVCAFPEETVEIPVTQFELNRDDFSLFYAGDSWRLYNGEIPDSEIVWTSDNEEVVIIEAGRVVAVGEGTTYVHAEYDGKKHSCIVRVKFKEFN